MADLEQSHHYYSRTILIFAQNGSVDVPSKFVGKAAQNLLICMAIDYAIASPTCATTSLRLIVLIRPRTRLSILSVVHTLCTRVPDFVNCFLSTRQRLAIAKTYLKVDK